MRLLYGQKRKSDLEYTLFYWIGGGQEIRKTLRFVVNNLLAAVSFLGIYKENGDRFKKSYLGGVGQ